MRNLEEHAAAEQERLRVRRWRHEQFAKLGFTQSDSAKLAEATADLNLMRRLIHAGCPPETAFRIVL
jgi:hypothetical protein